MPENGCENLNILNEAFDLPIVAPNNGNDGQDPELGPDPNQNQPLIEENRDNAEQQAEQARRSPPQANRRYPARNRKPPARFMPG